MIISIGGVPGSGKSTVAKLLAEELNYDQHNIGGIRREMAQKKGMTLEEYNKFGERDDSTDKDVDDYQIKLGKTKDNFVIEGRMSWKFIPNSIKVYLDCDIKIAAKRLYQDSINNPQRKNEAKINSEKDALDSIKKRMDSDSKRYIDYYGVDSYDKTNFDLVIDTTKKGPYDVVKEILEYVNKNS